MDDVKNYLTVISGMTDPQPMAEAIPTNIRKMSRGEANASTLWKNILPFFKNNEKIV